MMKHFISRRGRYSSKSLQHFTLLSMWAPFWEFTGNNKDIFGRETLYRGVYSVY